MILAYACSAIAICLGIAALSVCLSLRRDYGSSSTAKRMRSLEARSTELQEQVDDLRLYIRRSAAREGMRKIREMRRETPVEAPVASTDPEAIRAEAKRQTRLSLDMPENPVQAVLKNLGGGIKRVK